MKQKRKHRDVQDRRVRDRNTILTIVRKKVRILYKCLAPGVLLAGCGGGDSVSAPAPEPAAPGPPTAAQSDLRFVNVSAQSGLIFEHRIAPAPAGHPDNISGGVAAADYDGDGYIDLYLIGGNGSTSNRLYRNDGSGSIAFTDVSAAAGVAMTGIRGSGPAFADIDGDSRVDLIVGSVAGDDVYAFINQGDGTFQDFTAASGLSSLSERNSFSTAFGDYDLDGDLDLAVSHWDWDEAAETLPPIADTQTILANNGDGTFINESIASGLAAAIGADGTDYSFTPNFADIDGDGYPDLLLAADFGTSQVLLNNRDGTFSDATTAAISDENGMGAAIGDYDNDGDLDWFVTAIAAESGVGAKGFTGNRLYNNDGTGTFTDVTDQAGVRDGGWGWGSCFADFNNDGSLDIFHVNGWIDERFTEDVARLFIADGRGSFADVALESGITTDRQGRGVVCADFDRDGDIDILTFNNQNFAELYENVSAADRNFLTVVLQGQAPNSQGVGARVYVTAGGVSQMREISIGSNFVSHNPAEAHFGLGPEAAVAELRVRWPSGATTTLTGVPANQLIIIEE